jgi:hypothetical protein
MEAPLGAANSTRIAGASRPASSWTSASGWSSAPVNVVGAIDETVIFCLTDDNVPRMLLGIFRMQDAADDRSAGLA